MMFEILNMLLERGLAGEHNDLCLVSIDNKGPTTVSETRRVLRE